MKPNIKQLFLPKNKMATNKQFKQSLNYLGGIIFHGLEYLIGPQRLSFVLIFNSTNSFFTIFLINIGFKMKVSGAIFTTAIPYHTEAVHQRYFER